MINSPSISFGHSAQPIACLHLAHLAWRLYKTYQEAPECLYLIFADSAQQARELNSILQQWLGEEPVHWLADREVLPYDHFSPNSDVISLRLKTLASLADLNQGILIISLANAMTRMIPTEFIAQQTFRIAQGEVRPLDGFVQDLSARGYQRVSQVFEPGEFALRGALLDVYPMGSSRPYRVEWFDDEIETLRSFDPLTQRTLERVEGVHLLPAREYEFTPQRIDLFRQNYRLALGDDSTDQPVFKRVSQGEAVAGIEFFLPLFFKQGCIAFTDYLANKNLRVIRFDSAHTTAEQFYRDVLERYRLARLNTHQSLLAPQALFLATEDLFAWMKGQNIVQVSLQDSPATQAYQLPLMLITQGKEKLQGLMRFIQGHSGPVVVACESLGRREVILQMLHEHQLMPKVIEPPLSQSEAIDATQGLFLIQSVFEQGFVDGAAGFAMVTESELFGQSKVRRRAQSQARHEAFSESIKHIAELNDGDPVVHIEHGVGRYRGMERLDSGGLEREYIKLSYANDDSLYLPVEQLHLLSRYGGVADTAPLHRLGSGAWEKARERARLKVQDVAAELLDIYARREAAKGHEYQIEATDYQSFAQEFPFDETPDQETAIAAVIEDMANSKPMDRLICGDVGFGKTEVAMRAAFIAVQNGKQVAILVPTTLLASQHFKNFEDRFARWPIKIALLSRFTTGKDTQQTLQALENGQIDIIIGTHKLIQPSVKFNNLGLIILDEEHRFGVKQKETFKNLRSAVDVLTMTATPIPRTLNMALSELRALSIIATPPAKRISVKTFVHEWNDAILKEACQREFYRGGQVYLLHNHVETIMAFAQRISELLPDALIEVAHGQMPERELERIMQGFYHQRFNLLICTTIIETGIDNPNANTIIIDRADKFGLAQLHQLRGRVGRSWHQAYAWLFTPHPSSLTKDAQRRLEVIARHDHLGAGFTLASQDLEIRGAGELLGDEQSGHIQEIGFGLYSQMLEAAVKALRKGELPSDPWDQLKRVCEVNLNESALIPQDYLPDVASRLMLYKRLAMLENEEGLKELQVEIIDRFGLFPESVTHMIDQARLRLKAQAIGIQKIEVGYDGALIQFSEKPNIDPLKIIQLLQSRSKHMQMKGPHRLRTQAQLANFEQKYQHVLTILEALSP